MNDARMYKGLMLTLVMLLSAISPILSPVSADHDNGAGTGMNNYGPQIDLSIWDNNSSSWDVISPYEEVFLDVGTYQMEILSSNLSLNDSYMIEWDIFSYGVEDMMGEEEPDSIYESRNWTGYYNSSSESFNITVEEFNCGNWIEINLYNQSGMNQLAFGEYQIIGPCGSNGILSTHIEIDNNEYEVEHMFITEFDGNIELETGNYNMSWSVPNQTFNYNQDYLIQFSRGVGSMDSYNETEGNYSWTDGSQQGVGLGSQTWTIEVTDETCEINNDGLLWQAAYFSNGSWDQNNSTLMSTSLTTMSGPCEMPEMPEFELHYDNGSGPVMWETAWNYEEFENCNENTYEDGYSDWECEVDYDGDGMVDYTSYYESCEYDNASMMFWCETWEEYPYLESGNYTITLNVSNLEIGQIYDLSWDIDEIYDNYEFNATSGYEHFELVIEVDEYLCYTSAHVELYSNGYYLEDNFGFNGDCEEPVSDHFFELYYDNGTEVVMWEQTITYEEFDNCDEYEEGHWECEVDHNDDGNIDHYAHFRDCMWDNSSMTYWCEAHHMPMLEPGEYTLILNATMLDIGTDYELDWDLHIEGMDYNSEEMNVSWTASDEYEHFEWDIEVNESMCMLHSNVEMHTYDTNNSTHGFAYFDFNGLCEEPPKPLELYYNDMLFKGDMIESESDVPKLDAGINYMSWDMIGLEIGDEYNLTWSTIQMGMFEDGEEEEPNIEIFAADSEEMMHDWELEIENDTCMIMIAGVLTTNDNDDLSGFLGMVWAMFNGPCEIDMGDVGLDMLNPDDGDWYEMDGMNGSDTLGMMMFTDSEEDEMNMIMSLMENSNMKLETGNYTMRWAFEDLEIGKEYLVFMDDLLLDMYDDSSEYAYHDNCSEEYNEEEDEWYYLCEVENDDGSIDYLTYEYCYEYNNGMYECEVYDNDDDILTMFNASSDSEYYEWELTITDDTCGHVFVIGIVDAENGEDSMPIALSMYAIAGPNMSSCFGHEDNGPSPEDWMSMADTDGDGNMSWDEIISFIELDEPLNNETYEIFYEFFTESDWNGDGTLDLEELSYFLPMIMSLDDGDDGISPESLMSLTDMDEDGNMSWDEFTTFMNEEDSIDNETLELFYEFFTESDWNGDGTLDLEELSYFIPMVMSLDDDDDGMGVEDLMSMADLNGDGNMSWDEFYEFAYNNMGGENIDNETWSYWNGHFDNADMDSDGQLNMTELNEFWYRINDDSDDGMDAEDLMWMTDTDGDGNMSWDELITFLENEDSVDNETMELIYQFFTESDSNGDGTLDMDEISMFVSMMRNLDDDDDGMGFEDLMSMADLNGDLNMSWDEFYEFMYNNMGGENIDNETWSYWNGHFDNADMDSDGQLNMTELNEFWDRVTGDSDDVWDLSDFALGQDWTVSLGYTDTVNFTFYLGATQILADEFRTTADMEIGDGDGYLNATEAEQVYFWLLDNLDTNPQGPGNITLNGVPAEIVFIGYDIMDLSSDSSYNSAIITTWDVIFHDVSSDDGHYTFSYIEDEYDAGVDTPANFCAVSYEYSYQIMEFVWNGTNIDLADIGECIMLNVGEVVPSFSITYGQEANMDYDNDGVDNEDDAFPYDPSETMDTDGDGWGDNADAFPNDATEWLDTDGDGVGDNADTDYDGDGTDDDQEDSDGDGVNDNLDDFPNDANESTDTDGDGVGDNSDVFPNDANESSDLDGDGIGDNGDEDADGDGTPNDVDDFPLASSSNDADNDGVVNEIDAFPNNPNEYFDTDGDGTGDNADLDDDNDGYADTVDAFPNDASEYLDSDGDGMGDNEDQFPNDANEKKDSDGDGVGDNSDAFPSNFNDWADTDNDGVGDNADAFPNDATEIVDSDGDGVGNNADAFPYNANEQSDSDGDGVGDNAQAEQEGGTNPEPEPVDVDGGFLPGFSSAMGIVSMLGAAILIAGRRKD
jgi:Ca2+-binding EF-hand superfamily protein